jgi:hypothetical protein
VVTGLLPLIVLLVERSGPSALPAQGHTSAPGPRASHGTIVVMTISSKSGAKNSA